MPIHRSRSGFCGVVPKRGPSALLTQRVDGGSDIEILSHRRLALIGSCAQRKDLCFLIERD